MRQDKPADHEVLLLDYAQRIGKNLSERRAVHVHLSKLKPFNQRDHHIRFAVNSFDALLARCKGQLFVLSNNDIVAVLAGATVAEIDEVVLKLRFLFEDDPLSKDESQTGQIGETGNSAFCTWFDLERSHDDFRRMAEDMLAAAEARRIAQQKAQKEEPEAAEERVTVALTSERLGVLETQLKSMDLMPLIRRQPVCALTESGSPTPVFNELYVSIAELQRAVMPDVDLSSSRWLFQHLTEVLDTSVMRLLPELEIDLPLSTSININISTLLSPAFLEFDRKLRAVTKKTIVLEVQSIDLFANMSGYLLARDFVRERGYRVCLDGFDLLTFPIVGRQQVGFDFQKIQWQPDIEDEVIARRRAGLVEAGRAPGPTRVILNRCESPRALDFGRSIGITLFQGRHIDKLAKLPALSDGERLLA